jgi:hypothetical protein
MHYFTVLHFFSSIWHIQNIWLLFQGPYNLQLSAPRLFSTWCQASSPHSSWCCFFRIPTYDQALLTPSRITHYCFLALSYQTNRPTSLTPHTFTKNDPHVFTKKALHTFKRMGNTKPATQHSVRTLRTSTSDYKAYISNKHRNMHVIFS